jgi:HEAT repeat protein
VEAVMAAIACAGPIIADGAAGQRVWDDAVAALLKLAESAEWANWNRSLSVLSSMAFQHSRQNCAASEVVFQRAMPALAAALRRDNYGGGVPGIARYIGPLAAPLVSDLIPLLEKGDTSGAVQALGAIGPQAAPAVPALRAVVRRGHHTRSLAIAALGGIGEAAGPALADFAPLLKHALPDLCHLQPRESEDDTITWEIADAAGRIGGPALAPLFPDLVGAYRLLRSCRLLGKGDWSRLFAAAGRSGRDVAPTLLEVALDPDEALNIRRAALASLDQVGAPPSAQARLAAVRAGLARKQVLFPPRVTGPEPQRRAPPRPPPASDPRQTPRAFELCRQEAGLPAPAAPASVAPVGADFSHAAFIACVEDRLCGPDQATYGATMSICCRPYGAERPWFCEPRAPPR